MNKEQTAKKKLKQRRRNQAIAIFAIILTTASVILPLIISLMGV